MTAAWCGLAGNELQGLQWRDVDLYQGTITVGRTGYRYGAGGDQDGASSSHGADTVRDDQGASGVGRYSAPARYGYFHLLPVAWESRTLGASDRNGLS